MSSEDKKFSVGDLVFARMKGYPPWPARIEKKWPAKKGVAQKHTVFFFGTHNIGVIEDTYLLPYEEHKHKLGVKRKLIHFNESLEEIEIILQFRKKIKMISENTDTNADIDVLVPNISTSREEPTNGTFNKCVNLQFKTDDQRIDSNNYCIASKFVKSVTSNERQVFIDLDDESQFGETTSEDDSIISGDSDIEYNDRSDFESKNDINSNDIQNSIPIEKITDNNMSDDSNWEWKDWSDFLPKIKLNSDLNNEAKSSTTFAMSTNTVPVSSSYFNEDFDDKKNFKTNDDNRKDVETNAGLKSILELYKQLDIDKRFEQILKKDRKTFNDINTHKVLAKSVERVEEKADQIIKSNVYKVIDKNVDKTDRSLSSQKTHKEVENTSKKLIEKEVKNDVNADVEVFVPTPSTSRAEPRSETSIQSCVDLPSVQMKDESTDPKFHYHTSDKIFVPNADTPSNNITTEIEKIWIFICLKCSKSFETRNHFSSHHLEVHSGEVKKYQKMEKHLLDESSLTKNKEKSKQRSKNRLKSALNSSDFVPKIKSKTKSKETINRLMNRKTKKSKNKTNKNDSDLTTNWSESRLNYAAQQYSQIYSNSLSMMNNAGTVCCANSGTYGSHSRYSVPMNSGFNPYNYGSYDCFNYYYGYNH